MYTDFVIKNVRFAGDTHADSWILVKNGRIAAIGTGIDAPAATETIDGAGALALPGIIDCHVHFREPGMTHKADIASESRAAILGGVTSCLEMPNTKPPTTTCSEVRAKEEIAARDSMVNYAFFIGATNNNIAELEKADYSRIPGIKLFMGSSTGNMLVDQTDTLNKIFTETDAIIAVHAEDQDIIAANTETARRKYGDGPVPVAEHSNIRSTEACLSCTTRAVQLARDTGHRLHICHITTAAELDLLESGNPAEKTVTAEVSPHHLMWCDTDYAAKGTRIKMNPAVKTAADRSALCLALETGLIDMVATDHAPHLLQEKEGDALTAVSGAPLVQFSLPVMLSLFDEKTVQRTMCLNPAIIYRIQGRGSLDIGNYADICLVHETEPYTVTDADAASKCGWTPLCGETLCHQITDVWVNGLRVLENGTLNGKKGAVPLRFNQNK